VGARIGLPGDLHPCGNTVGERWVGLGEKQLNCAVG
jgi:hypothetical protein